MEKILTTKEHQSARMRHRDLVHKIVRFARPKPDSPESNKEELTAKISKNSKSMEKRLFFAFSEIFAVNLIDM